MKCQQVNSIENSMSTFFFIVLFASTDISLHRMRMIKIFYKYGKLLVIPLKSHTKIK